tara:strand:+ start:99 stop:590 length:492 start_codon:yes stop_codon:yes gene_type:complete
VIQAKHCDLCKFPKRDLKVGLTCGLTDKKPTFKNSCPDIKFSNSFKKYLPELLAQIERLRKQKTSVYLNFTLWGVIGLIVIILTGRSRFDRTSEFDFSYSSYLYLLGTLVLIIVGLYFLAVAYSRLSNHLNSYRNVVAEKKRINKVLNNYDLNIKKLLGQKLK